MLFAGILSAYFIARISAGTSWPTASHLLPDGSTLMKPMYGLVNTILLISANSLVSLGVRLLLRGNSSSAWKAFAMALLLGSFFIGIKLSEYQQKVLHHLLPATADAEIPLGRVWSSYYFGLTGLHAVHVVLGLLMLAWLVFLGVTGYLGKRQHVLAQNVSSYWYLVDAVWLVLFPLLYFL
jgi:heme/copper-type cytochrome/quinol oxidase subunit 3